MTTSGQDERAVLAAEDRRYQALVAGDLDALEEVFADELSYTHSSGAVDTKASYLEKLRTGYYVYQRIDHPVDRVSVVGDCAIVVGRMIADLEVQGSPKHLDNLALAVWTRARGPWQLLAFAPTPIPR
jgi:ketosteroid isomerase-like protein